MNVANAWLIRLSRHIGIYGAGSIANLVAGVVSVAAVTRFLPPSGFGKLGVLLAFQSLLTIVYDLGTIQGTFRRTFGHSDDGDDGGDADDDDEVPEAPDKRRALGTGLMLCILIAATGTAIIAIAREDVAQLLTGDRANGGVVVIAAAGGAANAVWRLTLNVIRLERRPVTNVALSSLRPFLMAAGSIGFLAAGAGVGGALAGNAIGSALGVVFTIVASWGSYRPNLDFGEMIQTFRVAARWVPIVIGFWVIHNGDVIILTRFVSDHDIGLYRLATRVGGMLSFYVGAIMSAWNPLRRTPMFAAARQEVGMELGATLIFYYWLISAWVLVGLFAAADLLVKVGGPGYAEAAPVIPLAGAGLVAYGGYMTMYRGSAYFKRSQWHVIITVIAALVFIASALILIPLIGIYGAALATSIAFLFGMFVTLYQSQRGPAPVPIRYRRLLAMGAIAGGCVALSKLVGPLAGDWEPVVDAVAIVLYPVLILVTGVIPAEQRRAIVELMRSIFTRQTTPSEDLLARLASLAPADRQALELVVVRQETPAGAAELVGEPEPELAARLGRTVCEVVGVERRDERNEELGRYLFASGAVAEIDMMSYQLMHHKIIQPAHLATLELTVNQMKRIPPESWRDLERPTRFTDPVELEEAGLEFALDAPGVSVARPEVVAAAGDGEPAPAPSAAESSTAAPKRPPESFPPPPEPPPGWVVAPPDFVGIDATSSATTRWFDLIVAHPDVSPPLGVSRELEFFEQYVDGQGTVRSVEEYAHYFPRPPGDLTGEWTCSMPGFWLPRLLAKAAPEVVLIVILRDPVERFRHELARARAREEPQAASPTWLGDVANRGLYFQQLRRLLRFFATERMLVLQHEACRADPAGQLQRTYEFLGLQSFDPGAELLARPAEPSIEELAPSVRRDLVNFYRSDVRALGQKFRELDTALWPEFDRG